MQTSEVSHISFSKEEALERKRANGRKWAKKHLDKVNEKLHEIFGDPFKCVICGSNKRIEFHEIHGKKHIYDREYILAHQKDFVPLCNKHHITVHRSAEVAHDKKAQRLIRTLAYFIYGDKK